MRNLLPTLAAPPRSIEEVRHVLRSALGDLPVLDTFDAAHAGFQHAAGKPHRLEVLCDLCLAPKRLNADCSEMDVAHFLDGMLVELLELALESGVVAFTWSNNASELRPDQFGLVQALLVWKAEVKRDRAGIGEAIRELTSKMGEANPYIFGELPFVLAYAAGADEVQFFALCPATRVAYEVSERLLLNAHGTVGVQHRRQAMLVVLNCARILLSWRQHQLLKAPVLQLYSVMTRPRSSLTVYPDHLV